MCFDKSLLELIVFNNYFFQMTWDSWFRSCGGTSVLVECLQTHMKIKDVSVAVKAILIKPSLCITAGRQVNKYLSM